MVYSPVSVILSQSIRILTICILKRKVGIMLFLSSLTIRKIHRYFLLPFLMTGIFSSSLFVHAGDLSGKYYNCSGKEMRGVSISSPLKLNVSFNGGKPTSASHCDLSGCYWLFEEELATGGASSADNNFFEVKNKRGDGIKFILKTKDNNCRLCESDYHGPSCSSKMTFTGALITGSQPIGKGLKVTGLSGNNKSPSRKDSLKYRLTITR